VLDRLLQACDDAGLFRNYCPMRHEEEYREHTFGTEPRESLLLVESAEFSRHRLRSRVKTGDREIHTASSAREALDMLQRVRVDVVLVSTHLTDVQGIRCVDLFLQQCGDVPLLVLSPTPTVEEAVEVLRRGASDYLPMSADRQMIGVAVGRALEEARARSSRQVERVRSAMRDQYGFSRLLTQSPRMLAVFDQIRQVATTDATVLILGETGTGKELVSRAIHDRSRRNDKPFISVNCGAFTESLLESELFGHEKGSFTGAVGRREGLFEMADGGTLFLDELGETSANVQVNLLRVLEEMAFRRVGGRERVHVNVRVIAATNVNLDEAVRTGKFREDVYYRLNVFPIMLPPMRERKEDVPLLMRHFLDELSAEYRLEAPVITAAAMDAIRSYHWPGNVRQLRAMCERWVITRSGHRLEREHLPSDMVGAASLPQPTSAPLLFDEAVSLRDNVARVTVDLERAYLFRVLERERGHLGRTASAAGVTRRTLYTKLKQYGVDSRDFKE
jgi:DNA-binding NtrC family response regulator